MVNWEQEMNSRLFQDAKPSFNKRSWEKPQKISQSVCHNPTDIRTRQLWNRNRLENGAK